MRISTAALHNNGANQISRLGEATARSQELIASGRAFRSASDDPLAAAGIARIEADRALRAQYLATADAAQTHLQLEDTTLNQVLDVLQRVRELTLQAGDPALTSQDRSFLSAELSARTSELLALANTQDARGNYLFAGYQGKTEPFAETPGGLQYVGDQGTRSLTIDRSTTISLGSTGAALFEAIDAEQTMPWVRPESTVAANVTATVTDAAAFADFAPENLQLSYRLDAAGTLLVSATRVGDGRIVDGIDNVPASAEIDLPSIGLSVSVNGAINDGDGIRIDSSPNEGLLARVGDIARSLSLAGQRSVDNAESRAELRDLIDRTLVGVDNGMNRLLEAQASIGALQNRIEGTAELHRDIDLQSQQALSDLQDVDFAKAVSDLNYQAFLLEAAQQSFVRINRLSLFNAL